MVSIPYSYVVEACRRLLRFAHRTLRVFPKSRVNSAPAAPDSVWAIRIRGPRAGRADGLPVLQALRLGGAHQSGEDLPRLGEFSAELHVALFGSWMGNCKDLFGTCCLDVRTFTFCQTRICPIKTAKI